MKKIAVLFICLLAHVGLHAQVKPYKISMAIKSTSSPQELYKLGKNWFIDKLQCLNKRLVLDDGSQGVIVGQCFFTYQPKVEINSARIKGTVEYTVKLRFRDGWYEYEFSDFRHKGAEISLGLLTDSANCPAAIQGVSDEWKKQVWDDLKAQASAIVKSIIKDMVPEISRQDVSGKL
ncbi:MAG: hypothetical protein KatS3mg031_0371 [Chitinophagales bacterium]|nr:MAG: hypothetical protein KatS3mg031_0371 [Chitinophagales bacterium]